MSSASVITGCAEKGCQVLSDGKCLNGINPPHDCPHISISKTDSNKDNVKVTSAASQETTISASTKLVPLHRGGELDAVGAENIARRRGVKVVALFAPSNAGKTTLIAKLYEAFHRGPQDHVRFSGSETLVAFEKLCHGCHTNSGASVPITPRTRRSEPNYLHLVLENNGRISEFLIVDRNGEEYMEAVGSSESCKKLFEIARCDVLMMLVDGGEMLDSGRRNVLLNDVRTGLHAFFDNNLLDHHPVIQILMTKYDMIEADPGHQLEVDKAFSEMEKAIAHEFREKSTKISFAKVAARPVLAPTTAARHLDRVISGWPFNFATSPDSKSVYVRPARAFMRFGRS